MMFCGGLFPDGSQLGLVYSETKRRDSDGLRGTLFTNDSALDYNPFDAVRLAVVQLSEIRESKSGNDRENLLKVTGVLQEVLEQLECLTTSDMRIHARMTFSPDAMASSNQTQTPQRRDADDSRSLLKVYMG